MHLDAADAQDIRDHRPVAAPPHRFRAQRGAQATGEFEQLVQAVGKLRAADMVGVATKRGVPPNNVRRIWQRPTPAAERGKPAIGDTMLGMHSAQRRLRVLRLPPRTGEAPHIRDRLQPIVGEFSRNASSGRVACPIVQIVEPMGFFVLQHRGSPTASRAFLNRSCAAPSPCAWQCARSCRF